MNLRTGKALGAALLLVAAAACTDTTVEPKSTVTEANVFNDPGSYQAFIARVYAGLSVTGQVGAAGNADIAGIDEGFSQYIRLLWELQELPTDAAVLGWGDVGIRDLVVQGWGSTNPFLNAMYYRVYFQVMMANEFLRQTTSDKLAARGNVSSSLNDQIQTYRAEARFLRALSYWHGLDIFGGNIPLVTEADGLGATPPQPAADGELYAFIESELLDLIADNELPAAGAANYGRASIYAARMLLAKLYMNAAVYTGTANYSGAMTQLTAVISGPFSLAANYRDNFVADNHNSLELIFAVTNDGRRTQTWGGMTFLVHAACGNQMNAGDYGIDGCWWGLRLKPEAYNLYGAGDNRTSYFFTTGQSVAIGNIGDFSNGIAAPKFTNRTAAGAQGSHPTFPDTDFPMFRLADAYLMYAEAVARGGGGSPATALSYINAIRQRAYGGPAGDVAADSAASLDFILNERGRELLWEAHRRTDLIRYGRFTGGTYLWAWKGDVQAGTSTAAHLGLYPLPANELIANPNLQQNPGY
jgi:hypothetical protein